jgi:hypothetical protein
LDRIYRIGRILTALRAEMAEHLGCVIVVDKLMILLDIWGISQQVNFQVKSSRVQEFKSSRVQEFKSSRVQEF